MAGVIALSGLNSCRFRFWTVLTRLIATAASLLVPAFLAPAKQTDHNAGEATKPSYATTGNSGFNL